MAKELAILAVSMITLLVAGYAAYSVMELSDTPSPRQVSAEKELYRRAQINPIITK